MLWAEHVLAKIGLMQNLN